MRIDAPSITGSFTLGATTLPDGNALATTGSNTFAGNQIINGTQTVNGNLIVTGSLTAQQYIISSSVTYLTESFASGSHKFGDSLDDTHQFTGSVYITGSLNMTGSILSTNYYSQPSTTISGLGTLDFGIIGRGTTNGTALLLNDIAGANYAISTGGYNLSFYKHVSGSNTFANAMSINGTNASNTTPSVTINNNLGIGVATPTLPLHVSGSGINMSRIMSSYTYSTGFADAIQVLYPNMTGSAKLSLNVGRDESSYDLAKMVFNYVGTNSSSNYLGFGFYNYDNLLTLQGTGNVGIGSTNPTNKLEVDGGSSSVALRISTTNTSAGVSSLILANSTKTAYNDGVKISHGGGYTSITDLSGTTIMNWDVTNTRVGIGTASPSYTLDVTGNSRVAGDLYVGTYHSTNKILPGGDANHYLRYNSSLDGLELAGYSGLMFTTYGGNERMHISLNGNIGVNQSNPNDAFVVQGVIAKYTTTGIDGTFENAYKIGYYNDLRVGGTGYTNRWAGLDVSTTAGAAASNILRVRVYPGGGGNPAPVTVVDFRGDQSAGFAGAISKASGTFKIDHPLESKKDTNYLVHSFIEGPRVDLIYRGTVKLINGTAIINIDETVGMTEGTFTALNRETQVFTTNETSWDAVKGKIEGNLLTITCQNSNSNDEISWMVIGERQDEHIRNTGWTDEKSIRLLVL